MAFWASLSLLAGCAGPASPSPSATLHATAPAGTPDGSPTPLASPSPAATFAFGEWRRLADAPVALTEVAVAAHGGRIWVVGGLDPAGRSSTAVQLYDPVADAWAGGPALPRGLDHAALLSTGPDLFVIGGYARAQSSRLNAAVYRLDEWAREWKDGPALPEPRAAGAAAWDGARIVYGGGVGPGGGQVAGDVLVLGSEGWTVGGRLDVPREHLAAASDGEGRVWFLGGRVGGLGGNLALVDLVEAAGVRGIGEVPTARGGVAAFWVDGVGACLAGGEGPSGTFDEVECVDADGRVTDLPRLAFPRHGLGAAVIDGVAYVALGGPVPGLTVSPVLEALDLP